MPGALLSWWNERPGPRPTASAPSQADPDSRRAVAHRACRRSRAQTVLICRRCVLRLGGESGSPVEVGRRYGEGDVQSDAAPVGVPRRRGSLIPFRARPLTEGRRSGGPGTGLYGEGGNPLVDRLDPEDGQQLLALKCPLADWAAGRPFVWLDDESPRRIAGGSPGTIRYERCCTVSTPTWA